MLFQSPGSTTHALEPPQKYAYILPNKEPPCIPAVDREWCLLCCPHDCRCTDQRKWVPSARHSGRPRLQDVLLVILILKGHVCDIPCPASYLGATRCCPAQAASLAAILSASRRKAAALHCPTKVQTLTALQVCWLAQVAAHCQHIFRVRPAAGPAPELAAGEGQAGPPLCCECQPGPAAALLCEERQLARPQGVFPGPVAALLCEEQQLACAPGMCNRSCWAGHVAKPQVEPLPCCMKCGRWHLFSMRAPSQLSCCMHKACGLSTWQAPALQSEGRQHARFRGS